VKGILVWGEVSGIIEERGEELWRLKKSRGCFEGTVLPSLGRVRVDFDLKGPLDYSGSTSK